MSNLQKLNKKASAASAAAVKAQRTARSAVARAALQREAERLASMHRRWLRRGDLRDYVYPRDLEVLPYLERGMDVSKIAAEIGMMPSEIWQSIMRLL